MESLHLLRLNELDIPCIDLRVKWDCLSIVGVLLNESSLVDAVSTHAILILGKRL